MRLPRCGAEDARGEPFRAVPQPWRPTGVEDPGASPPQQAQAATDRAQLERCLSQLEPRRRALISAAFFEGSTYEELATRLQAPLGSVKSWIRRSLLQLRECLGP